MSVPADTPATERISADEVSRERIAALESTVEALAWWIYDSQCGFSRLDANCVSDRIALARRDHSFAAGESDGEKVA